MQVLKKNQKTFIRYNLFDLHKILNDLLLKVARPRVDWLTMTSRSLKKDKTIKVLKNQSKMSFENIRSFHKSLRILHIHI